MLLSNTNVSNNAWQKRRPQVKGKFKATIVIELEDGKLITPSDWKNYNYKALRANKAERDALEKFGYI